MGKKRVYWHGHEIGRRHVGKSVEIVRQNGQPFPPDPARGDSKPRHKNGTINCPPSDSSHSSDINTLSIKQIGKGLKKIGKVSACLGCHEKYI